MAQFIFNGRVTLSGAIFVVEAESEEAARTALDGN